MSKLKHFARSVVNLPLMPINMYRRSKVPRRLKETAYGTNASIKYPVKPEYLELWKNPEYHTYEVESTFDMRPPAPPAPPAPPVTKGGDYSPHTYSKNYKPGMSSRGTGLHPLKR